MKTGVAYAPAPVCRFSLENKAQILAESQDFWRRWAPKVSRLETSGDRRALSRTSAMFAVADVKFGLSSPHARAVRPDWVTLVLRLGQSVARPLSSCCAPRTTGPLRRAGQGADVPPLRALCDLHEVLRLAGKVASGLRGISRCVQGSRSGPVFPPAGGCENPDSEQRNSGHLGAAPLSHWLGRPRAPQLQAQRLRPRIRRPGPSSSCRAPWTSRPAATCGSRRGRAPASRSR